MMLVTFLLLLAWSATPSLALPSAPATIPSLYNREVAGTNRRGISYNKQEFVHLFRSGNFKTTWTYNWDSSDNGLGDSGYEYVPMLHSDLKEHTDRIAKNVAICAAAGPGLTHVLGFNEPDMCTPGSGGACMSLQRSLDAWYAFMQPLAQTHGDKVKLGSPAVSNDNSGGKGLVYLAEFLSRCSGCRIDFVNIHWYDSAKNVGYFKNHVAEALKVANGRPVWITEFGASGTDDEIVSFMAEVFPWLDSQPQVHRYAWTMAMQGLLVNAAGDGLSRIGQAFNTL